MGTDSHTTMINGLGVVGWGVGGIEAEAVVLGQPYYMLLPEVVGMKLTGALPEGATATDLVLRVTEMLRKHGVVGRFVEFYGAGLSNLTLPDKATLANMAPEYGATIGFFPVDDETLEYLRAAGGAPSWSQRVERISTGARPLPDRRDAGSGVHLDARAGPVHGGTQPGRTQAPAGPDPARRHALGVRAGSSRAGTGRLRPPEPGAGRG